MTIKDLIKKLESHPNKEADINAYINVINGDEENYDEKADIEIISLDAPYDNVLDMIIIPTVFKDEADVNSSIQNFLSEYNQNKITIEIDIESGIFIKDKDGGILRECELSEQMKDKNRVSRITTILLKLRKML